MKERYKKIKGVREKGKIEKRDREVRKREKGREKREIWKMETDKE